MTATERSGFTCAGSRVKVRPEDLCAAQVDVLDSGTRLIGVYMDEDAHDPFERALDPDLLGTEQRHFSESDCTCPCGRKRRGEVRGRSEDDAHYIIRRQPVALKHRCEQFANHLTHFGRVVGDKAYRSTDGSHIGSLQTRLGIERTQFWPLDRAQPARPLLVEANGADARANQVLHRMADMVEHAPDDTVSALVNNDLDHRSIGGLLNDPSAVAFDDAVLQRDPFTKGPQCILRELAADSSDVRLENLM